MIPKKFLQLKVSIEKSRSERDKYDSMDWSSLKEWDVHPGSEGNSRVSPIFNHNQYESYQGSLSVISFEGRG